MADGAPTSLPNLPPKPASRASATPHAPQNGVKLRYLAPLFWAPVLPCIYIAFRKQPRTRDILAGLGMAAAFSHGAYLLMFDLDLTNDGKR